MQSAILSLCSTLTTGSQYDQACNKAVEAGTKQTGTYQLLDSYETKTISYTENEASYHLGDESVSAVGATVYAYRTFRTKTLKFNLPNMGICNSVSNDITPNSYALHMKWELNWLK